MEMTPNTRKVSCVMRLSRSVIKIMSNNLLHFYFSIVYYLKSKTICQVSYQLHYSAVKLTQINYPAHQLFDEAGTMLFNRLDA